VVLLLTALAIHQNYVGSRETAVFRLVNGLALPGWTWPGVWLVMQLGVIGAVPLVAVVALATRHLRLAVDAVLAAGSIYLIAKVIKQFVQRGRHMPHEDRSVISARRQRSDPIAIGLCQPCRR
jgi:hypothetical protein